MISHARRHRVFKPATELTAVFSNSEATAMGSVWAK